MTMLHLQRQIQPFRKKPLGRNADDTQKFSLPIVPFTKEKSNLLIERGGSLKGTSKKNFFKHLHILSKRGIVMAEASTPLVCQKNDTGVSEPECLKL